MMANATLKTVRDDCVAAIEAKRSSFVHQDFHLCGSSIPGRRTLEQLSRKPIVTVIGMAFDESRLTRRPTAERRIFIQVNVQAKLKVNDETIDEGYVDCLNQLTEEIAESLKVTSTVNEYPYAWQSNDFLRDPNGLPYSYEIFREDNVYQATFTAVFSGMQ